MEKVIKMEATQPIPDKFLDEFLLIPENLNRRVNDVMDDASDLFKEIELDIRRGCESGYFSDSEKP